MESTQNVPIHWQLDPPTSTDSGGPGSGQRKPPARPQHPTNHPNRTNRTGWLQ